jgi:5-formyltetrahydrofolate cyclo-ligase
MPDFASEAEMSTPPKFALRNRIITARRSLTEPTLRSAAAAIQSHLPALIALADPPPAARLPTGPALTEPPLDTPPLAETSLARPPIASPAGPIIAAAYVPVGWEPGGPDLLETLAAALPIGSRLLLPVLLDDGDLDWAAYDGPSSLHPGPRGLREPAGPRLGVDAIREAALLLVPALAVDLTGLRLGRGGGSYDRALARTTDAFTVALLHDGEIVDSVPAENHDQPVRAAVTPRGGVTLSARPEWTK